MEIATPEDDTAYVALYESVPTSMVFLSDLVPSNDPPPNGWGPIEYNISNGEQAAGDGIPMAIGGVRYAKGLGVHAASDVRYSLGGLWAGYLPMSAFDDETGNGGIGCVPGLRRRRARSIKATPERAPGRPDSDCTSQSTSQVFKN